MRTVISGAETLLRVHELAAGDDDAPYGRMELGPWSSGADGSTLLGALSVLADDVMGYAIIADPARPADRWSVSTEITIDAIGALPAAPGEVVAVAGTRWADAAGAFATGEVRDAAGRGVAVVSQRARYVPLAALRDPLASQEAFDAPEGDLAAVLGMRSTPAGLAFEVVEPMRNPAGTLHGGVSMAAAAIAAERALDDGGPALRVLGIRTAFARAALLGMRVDVRAEVLHRGRTVATLDVVTLVDDEVRTTSRITAGL
jgi:acyl-coenzyme A thioesterase PaaI-like protein